MSQRIWSEINRALQIFTTIKLFFFAFSKLKKFLTNLSLSVLYVYFILLANNILEYILYIFRKNLFFFEITRFELITLSIITAVSPVMPFK